MIAHAAKVALKRLPVSDTVRDLVNPLALAPAIKIARKRGWDAAAQWLLSADGMPLLADSALHARLSNDVVLDAEVELLLTALRKTLARSPETLDNDAVLRFSIALMRQCHLNEHVFYVSDEEAGTISDMRRRLSETADRERWKDIVVVALYEAIEDLLETEAGGAIGVGTPDALRSYLDERMSEHRTEKDIAAEIHVFNAVHNPTSLKVAAMYEDRAPIHAGAVA